MATKFTAKEVQVARIVSEDDKFLLLEVLKDESETFSLQQGDQFYTLMFVRPRDGAAQNELEAWVPWKESSL